MANIGRCVICAVSLPTPEVGGTGNFKRVQQDAVRIVTLMFKPTATIAKKLCMVIMEMHAMGPFLENHHTNC